MEWLEISPYKPPICSECGTPAYMDEAGDVYKPEKCPHCGAATWEEDISKKHNNKHR